MGFMKSLFIMCVVIACAKRIPIHPPGKAPDDKHDFTWGCAGDMCGIQCNHQEGIKAFFDIKKVKVNEIMSPFKKVCYQADREGEKDKDVSLPERRLCTITAVPHKGTSELSYSVKQSKYDSPQVITKVDMPLYKNWCKTLDGVPEENARITWEDEECVNTTAGYLCPVHVSAMSRVVNFIGSGLLSSDKVSPQERKDLIEFAKSQPVEIPSNTRYMARNLATALLNFWEDYSSLSSPTSLQTFINDNTAVHDVYTKPSVEGRMLEVEDAHFGHVAPSNKHKNRLPNTVGRKEDIGLEPIGKGFLKMKSWQGANASLRTDSNDKSGYLVIHKNKCHVMKRGEMDPADEDDEIVISMMAGCAENEASNNGELCRCLGTTVPLYQDGSNSVCLMKENVKIESVEKSYHDRLDMCFIYCTVTTGEIEESMRPTYRTILYRTPFQNLDGSHRSGLEDRLEKNAKASPNMFLFESCWPESYESYMHDSKKQVLRRAFKDTRNWCTEHSDTGTRDLVDIPSTCLGGESTAFSTKHLKMYNEKTTTWSICTRRVELCYEPVCSVQVRATSLKAEVVMKAEYAKYIIRDGAGNVHEGYFVDEAVLDIEFAAPGDRTLHGICNKSPVERKVTLSTREFCNEKYPGPSGLPLNIYCKRPSLIKITFTILLVSIILHMGRKYLGSMSGVVGAIASFWIFWPFLKYGRCRTCYCFRVRPSKHECRTYRCRLCGKIFATDEGAGMSSISRGKAKTVHDLECPCSGRPDSDLLCSINIAFDVISWIVTWACKLIPATGGVITTIIILSIMWGGADALDRVEEHERVMSGVVKDIGDYIERLEASGFHPYNARFSPGLREKIESIKQEKDCATAVCTIVMTISATMEVTKGREFGFRVYPKQEVAGSNLTFMDLNVKFSEPVRECQYNNIYQTGKADHKSVSGDTCTEGCGPCFGYLNGREEIKSLKGIKPVKKYHENSASWACNGAGCAAINNGCTCGLCWCEVPVRDYTVKELVREETLVTLCLQFGSNGLCKQIRSEERTPDITVVKGGEISHKCPRTIACKDHTGECFEGDIAGVGDFGNKFGSIKIIGNQTLFKEEVRSQEQCLFAKHRWFEYKQCCKDTYHLNTLLKHVPFEMPKKGVDPNKKVLPVESAGQWTFEMRMPPYKYAREEDKLKLESLSIDSCHGCFDCEEGGSCLLHYMSTFSVTPSFDCSGARVDMSHITLERGTGQIPFNIFASKREGSINCTIGKFIAKGRFVLLDPPKYPHGDGVIKMDSKRVINNDCGHIFCNWSPFDFTFSTIKGYISTFILVVLIIVGIVIIYYSGTGLASGIRSILSHKAKEYHSKTQ